ncbi:oxysterol-binding protein 1-like [Oncorhynchus kisutch]|uniref:oxysterol-binding protein 1-like n=1 Tax=Oncorhynchus kisutch TaxID=8019 RepID=UPI0012DFB52A|nr:oxysterol-binding protein 1-like [Oncorhynchus kisutch]
MYFFTNLALTLNEPEEGVAPTDSRLRPDQRLMEVGQWDEANAEKQRLEEKQHSVHRERERSAASQRTASESEEGTRQDNYTAQWFKRCDDPATAESTHIRDATGRLRRKAAGSPVPKYTDLLMAVFDYKVSQDVTYFIGPYQ